MGTQGSSANPLPEDVRSRVYIPLLRISHSSKRSCPLTMPPTRLQLAKNELSSFFDHAGKAVFSRQDMKVLLSQNRTAWRLARSTTLQNFLQFLIEDTKLNEVVLRSKDYVLPARFTWGEVSPHLLALSLRKAGFLS